MPHNAVVAMHAMVNETLMNQHQGKINKPMPATSSKAEDRKGEAKAVTLQSRLSMRICRCVLGVMQKEVRMSVCA